MNNINNHMTIGYEKLFKHAEKIRCCIAEQPSSPITLEIQPTECCNCNCPHCISRTRYPDKERQHMIQGGKELDISYLHKLESFLPDNVIISGDTGDPLLYSQIDKLLLFFYEHNIPTIIITNGLALTSSLANIILKCCYNIRISVDATCAEDYAITHGTSKASWKKLNSNIESLVQLKKEQNSKCKIGIGYLTSSEVTCNLENAVLQAIEQGVDYIDFRPFQTYRCKTVSSELIDYIKLLKERYESDSFYIWYSHQKYNSLSNLKREYDVCLASYLYTVITPSGNLSLCCNRSNDPLSYYGNLYECDNWKELLQSQLKKQLIRNISKCPPSCRLHMYNIILSNVNKNDVDNLASKYNKSTRGSWDAI